MYKSIKNEIKYIKRMYFVVEKYINLMYNIIEINKALDAFHIEGGCI